MKRLALAILFPLLLSAQVRWSSTLPTSTSATINYNSGTSQVCSLAVADMNRSITIISGTYSAGTVTITTFAPHGLVSNTPIYIEQSDVSGWIGWQIPTVTAVNQFTFTSGIPGTGTSGNVGVLVDDLNTSLGGAFTGTNLDSRAGNSPLGNNRSFVVGKRLTVGLDSSNFEHTRPLQPNSRHHATLTCPANTGFTYDFPDFTTLNIALGDTHNEGAPPDIAHPGQYAYPNIQWSNQAQPLLDPVTGLISRRATGPVISSANTTSGVHFQTALNPGSAWGTPSGPLTTGNATYVGGACGTPGPACGLFFRADTLVIGNGQGGATYNSSSGTSFDMAQVVVTNASATAASNLHACMGINGIGCAGGTITKALNGTPSTYTFGSGGQMDFWQTSGPPPISVVDASEATGTVVYNSGTGILTYTGSYPFNLKWVAGSQVNVNGTDCIIGSVQTELQVTLSSCAQSSGTYAYHANNFGVFIWADNTTGTTTIGPTTLTHNDTQQAVWSDGAVWPTSPAFTISGKTFFDNQVATEWFTVAGDGSVTNDLGLGLTTNAEGLWPAGLTCGSSLGPYSWDPDSTYQDTAYCVVQLFTGGNAVVKQQYLGNHAAGTPNVQIADCITTSGVQPCMQFTQMTGNLNVEIPPFNPDYAASGASNTIVAFGGVSPDGVLCVAFDQGQETYGWLSCWSLGNRDPEVGLPGGSILGMTQISVMSTYRKAPRSYCTVHDLYPALNGYNGLGSNPGANESSALTYNMTLSSTHLNTTVGVAGGLNPCPTNPFGVTVGSNNCTEVTTTGQPTNLGGGPFLQNVQVGDVMVITTPYAANTCDEAFRVLNIVSTSPPDFWIQRGYMLNGVECGAGFPMNHSGTTFTFLCGCLNINGTNVSIGNYISDPLGANSSFTTILQDTVIAAGHDNITGGVPPQPVLLAAAGTVPIAQCPTGAYYDQTRVGSLQTAQSSPQGCVSINPQFAGATRGISAPGATSGVDTHPGPCTGTPCADARVNGGGPPGFGTVSSQWTNPTGNCWLAPSGSTLSRKFLTTLAYVGRSALVDVSGPNSASNFGCTSGTPYLLCVPVLSNECVSGSTPGQVYVNAPVVSIPWCYENPTAAQGDNNNSICVGDLGAWTGNLAQLGWTTNDLFGTWTRKIGPNFQKWNQQAVFWNWNFLPTQTAGGTNIRWADEVRIDNTTIVLPPYLSPDGVARNTFIPIPIPLTPPAGIDGVLVLFGYSELGGGCTTDADLCVANTGSVSLTTPFYLARETYSPMSCTGGTGTPCTVVAPALSGHQLVWSYEYLKGSTVVFKSTNQAPIAVP